MNSTSILVPLSWLYLLGQKIDAAWRRRTVESSPLPVISVGNLSAGGTGKTPVCIHMIETLQKSYHCILLSRGYGRRERGDVLWESATDGAHPSPDVVGDEPTLAARVMSNGMIAVSAHRARLLGAIAKRYPEDGVILLDDGFQHVQIARDCDIVIVDDDTVDDRPLPAGRLRESPRAIQRATVVLATSQRAEEFARSRTRIGTLILRIAFRTGPIRHWSTNRPWVADGSTALLVTGIAHPERVRASFESLVGTPPAAWLRFADHHRYTRSDVERMLAALGHAGATRIVTTAKDAVKLECFSELSHVLHAIDLHVEIEREEELLACLRSIISRKLSAITLNQPS